MKSYCTYFYLRYIRHIDTPAKLLVFLKNRNENKIILKQGDREFTAGQVHQRVNCLANSLLNLGMCKGDMLGVAMKNGVEFIEIRLACYKIGVVFCALIDDFDQDQVLQKVQEMKFKAFIFDNMALVPEIMMLGKGNVPEILVGLQHNEKEERILLYQHLIDQGSGCEPKCKIKPNEISAIGFTSGTTGKSKGVVWNHKAWIQSFYHFLLNANPTDGEMRLLQFIPFSTAGSLTVLPWIASGGKMIIQEAYSPKEVATCITKEKITHLTMVPPFLIDLWDYYLANRDLYDFSSLKSISVGSAPLAGTKIKQLIETFGPIIQQSYGMSEVLAPLASLKILDPEKESGLLNSVGVPVKQIKMQLKTKDDRGYEQIMIKSISAYNGYWTSEGIDASCFDQQWFVSDDIGSFDKAGNLFVRGRKSRIIDQDGMMVYPQAIEDIIHSFPGVKHVVVEKNATTITAYYTVRRGFEVDREKLIEFLEGALPKESIPGELVCVKDLPISTSGKLLKLS
jgi:acyl-CoA synthetase (AMP-forming)/AMP-acid ligase II